MERDQLSQLLNSKSGVYCQFKEGQLDFRPTYKYDKGTDIYDTGPKKRVPSWCDRILYVPYGSMIKQLSYERGETTLSDHRPVMSYFSVTMDDLDQSFYSSSPSQQEFNRMTVDVNFVSRLQELRGDSTRQIFRADSPDTGAGGSR